MASRDGMELGGSGPLVRPDCEITQFLGGEWRLERRIADLQSGTTGRLTGDARFTGAPGGLRYDERGTLVFGAYRGTGVQSYLFTRDERGGVEVQFIDGRFFHRLDLASGRAEVVHECPPDHYRGRYRICSPDRWTLTWLIQGPRKRMIISTRYARQSFDGR